MRINFPPCDIRPTFRYPEVLCHKHGPLKSGYWVCPHVRSGAAAGLFIQATPDASGVLFCLKCAEAEHGSAQEAAAAARGVALVCPICLHQAGLIDSPDIVPARGWRTRS